MKPLRKRSSYSLVKLREDLWELRQKVGTLLEPQLTQRLQEVEHELNRRDAALPACLCCQQRICIPLDEDCIEVEAMQGWVCSRECQEALGTK